MSVSVSDKPECPECGEPVVRSGPHFAIIGELSHMRFTEAADEYYQTPSKYDDRTVRKFACGHHEVVSDE